ncbi:hypothetical protein SAMN05444392_10919 [Seinonella peptonophila]|uniref:Uncharacterized protein n=1 Tax=Seinonella peptonophila TaxID=112248 RepID=A0A1M4ZFM7_9BACL|nr:hypothetical protein SAMN05444392_10919 [Seinonella peptonophila]
MIDWIGKNFYFILLVILAIGILVFMGSVVINKLSLF